MSWKDTSNVLCLIINTYLTNTGNCIGVARYKPIILRGLRFSSVQTASVRVCDGKWLRKTCSKIILALSLQKTFYWKPSNVNCFKCELFLFEILTVKFMTVSVAWFRNAKSWMKNYLWQYKWRNTVAEKRLPQANILPATYGAANSSHLEEEEDDVADDEEVEAQMARDTWTPHLKGLSVKSRICFATRHRCYGDATQGTACLLPQPQPI